MLYIPCVILTFNGASHPNTLCLHTLNVNITQEQLWVCHSTYSPSLHAPLTFECAGLFRFCAVHQTFYCAELFKLNIQYFSCGWIREEHVCDFRLKYYFVIYKLGVLDTLLGFFLTSISEKVHFMWLKGTINPPLPNSRMEYHRDQCSALYYSSSACYPWVKK